MATTLCRVEAKKSDPVYVNPLHVVVVRRARGGGTNIALSNGEAVFAEASIESVVAAIDKAAM